MRRVCLIAVTAFALMAIVISANASTDTDSWGNSWRADSYEGFVFPQGIQPERPQNASGIRGAQNGLSVDIVPADKREKPQNRFHFGQEVRFLFRSGKASVYIFGIGRGGEILYASSSHKPAPSGIKRYPPDALLRGEHGPITAEPPVGVSTFQIVVSKEPMDVLHWERWIAPSNKQPVPVSKLLKVIEILPRKYGAENLSFDFTQFCAEPPGGNFSGCPLGPPESLQRSAPRQPSPPSQPSPAPAECQGQSLAQFDTYSAGERRIIDDPEFFNMIDAWVEKRLCNPLFFSAIDLWVNQKRIPDTIALGTNSLQMERSAFAARFSVQGADQLRLDVFGLDGQGIYSQTALGSSLSWRYQRQDGRQLANGVYLARVTAVRNGQAESWVKKITVLR